MTSNLGLIINGDDLGISPGTNHAIREAHRHGHITHASLMANGDFAQDAVQNVLRECPGLAVGLHLNLTYGRPLTSCPSLARNGTLQWRFEHILRKTLQGEQALLADLEREIEAQFSWIVRQEIPVDHVNSHHHVHMIPAVFKTVKKLAGKYGIPRIRIPDESLPLSVGIAQSPAPLVNGGLVKFLLVKALVRLSRERADRRFFSLLFTGGVNRDMVSRARDAGERMELTVHPGLPEMDGSIKYYKPEQRRYRCSEMRRVEYEACLISP
jgi:predicted glycoside hydrolase/deacetylase ChbG (UPF0249 family)